MTVALARTDDAIRTLAPIAAPIAARASLEEYVRLTFKGQGGTGYDLAPHHALLIEHLEAVERGEIKRLMVFMPVRRGKSELVSIRFPAWYLGRNPDRQVIAASNTQRLARKWSRAVRKQIRNAATWPFPNVGLARGNESVDQWAIDGYGGVYQCAGVNTAIAGEGADLLSIDDPIVGYKQADSITYRDATYEWYQSDAETRLSPNGAIVLTHTRWHADDLAGRLLRDMAAGSDKWVVLELPEVAEEGRPDALNRQPGEYLWPNRWPPESTEATRLYKPAVWWPLYQQRPGALAGGMFKRDWFDDDDDRRFDPEALPKFQLVVIAIDSAFSTNVDADYSVIAVWAATKQHFYVLDIWRDRVDYPSLLTSIRGMYDKWRGKGLSPWIYIENKASGQSAIQSLRKNSRLPVQPYEPGQTSKIARAQDTTPHFGSGRVLLPKSAPWVQPWIEEHCAFPTGEHDDQVDSSSIAWFELDRAVRLEGMGKGDAVTKEDTAAA